MKNRLSDAEFKVMEVIWAQGNKVSSKVIRNELQENEWKRQTVLTLLSRLVEKDFLSVEKSGNENIYIVLVDEKAYLKYESGEFLNKYYNKSLVGFLNTFYGDEKVDSEEIDELRDWIDKKVK